MSGPCKTAAGRLAEAVFECLPEDRMATSSEVQRAVMVALEVTKAIIVPPEFVPGEELAVLARTKELAGEAVRALAQRDQLHREWEKTGNSALILAAADILTIYQRKCGDIVEILAGKDAHGH